MTSNIYPVPFGLDVSVEIQRNEKEDEAKVFVICPIYLRKRWEMNHSYRASHFTDSQILKDRTFISVLCRAFPSD